MAFSLKMGRFNLPQLIFVGNFVKAFEQWYSKWEKFLKERSVSETTNKSYYTHKRLRSAWLSLKRNLPCLFTFEDYRDLMIPNTTNGLDGSFADLKNKLRNHNGLNIVRKRKIIDGFFKAQRASKNIKGVTQNATPLFDIFVSHQVYPWQVAPQQSLLPFQLDRSKINQYSNNATFTMKFLAYFLSIRS